MKFCVRFFLSTLICVCVTIKQNSATVVSARCRSRCLAKEIERYRNITTIPVCISSMYCSACMKPCNQRKKEMMSCSILCGSFVHVRNTLNICKESCKFLKHLQLEDGNSSCPTGLADRECVLMTPENVEVATVNEKTQISWNGTWPSATVFVIMARQKGASPDVGASQGSWAVLKQTTLQSIQVLLEPLLWYQFKITATNQYGASPFSIPSGMIFANPTTPNPPRDFHVKSMNIVKGQAEVDVSWRKPDNIALPIHRYKLSWSMRLDLQLDKFTSLTVTDRRVKANIHQYTIKELQPNKTYVLEIQVISRWTKGRLRSQRVTLTVRTPSLAEDNIKKKIKKKFEMTKNSIVSPKKTANGDSAVVFKPTTPTTMQGTNSTKNSSTHQSQASTPKSNGRVSESPNLKAQKSIAGLISVQRLVLTVIALVVTILCCL